MPGGEQSPDELNTYVFGDPLNRELAVQQQEQLESRLVQAVDRGNPEEIETIQEQLRQLCEALNG